MNKLKLILIPLIYFCITSIAAAQPNGGFENWSLEFSYESPDDWQTLNFLSLTTPPNELSAFKAIGSDKYAGNYSLEVKTIYISNNPLPGSVADTFGCVFKGKITISPASIREGFPYTARPEKLQFFAKYLPTGNDTGWVVTVLKKQNTITGLTDTIAIGKISIPSNPDYTQFTMGLGYLSNEFPDSAVIGIFSSRDSLTSRVGSRLFIDEVLYSGWVGIDENLKKVNSTKVFPNPATEYITLQCDLDDADHIQIINNLGMNITKIQIDSKNIRIPTSAFNSGTYYYHIRNKLQKTINTGKFTISK